MSEITEHICEQIIRLMDGGGFGKNLRDYQLAAKLGISPSRVSEIRNGTREQFDIALMMRLCELSGRPLEYFLPHGWHKHLSEFSIDRKGKSVVMVDVLTLRLEEPPNAKSLKQARKMGALPTVSTLLRPGYQYRWLFGRELHYSAMGIFPQDYLFVRLFTHPDEVYNGQTVIAACPKAGVVLGSCIVEHRTGRQVFFLSRNDPQAPAECMSCESVLCEAGVDIEIEAILERIERKY